MMSNAEASSTQPHDDEDNNSNNNNNNSKNDIQGNLGILENASFNIWQQGFVLDKKTHASKRKDGNAPCWKTIHELEIANLLQGS